MFPLLLERHAWSGHDSNKRRRRRGTTPQPESLVSGSFRNPAIPSQRPRLAGGGDTAADAPGSTTTLGSSSRHAAGPDLATSVVKNSVGQIAALLYPRNRLAADQDAADARDRGRTIGALLGTAVIVWHIIADDAATALVAAFVLLATVAAYG